MSEAIQIMLISALGILAGALMGCKAMEERMRKEAIEHHAAHYHPQTGKFIWNDEVEPTK